MSSEAISAQRVGAEHISMCKFSTQIFDKSFTRDGERAFNLLTFRRGEACYRDINDTLSVFLYRQMLRYLFNKIISQKTTSLNDE